MPSRPDIALLHPPVSCIHTWSTCICVNRAVHTQVTALPPRRTVLLQLMETLCTILGCLLLRRLRYPQLKLKVFSTAPLEYGLGSSTDVTGGGVYTQYVVPSSCHCLPMAKKSQHLKFRILLFLVCALRSQTTAPCFFCFSPQALRGFQRK